MTTFVLVPGGWHGGWDWQPTAERLTARGHAVRALTLDGLDPGRPSSGAPNLDTHIDEVVGELDRADAPVVLCGHSYAGMVIAGAADRAPGQVARLVHVDAYVPADGDSCWSLAGEAYRQVFAAGAALDGRTVAVPPGLDPRARPHPVGSFLQAVRLTGAVDTIPWRTAIFATAFPATPVRDLRDRLREDPRWEVHDLPVAHAVPRLAPDALTDILTATDRPDLAGPTTTLEPCDRG